MDSDRLSTASIASTGSKEDTIATITVRGLDDDVQRRIKQRAALNNRSMEAEARAILSEAVAPRSFGSAWLELAAEFRGVELELPARTLPREIDLS